MTFCRTPLIETLTQPRQIIQFTQITQIMICVSTVDDLLPRLSFAVRCCAGSAYTVSTQPREEGICVLLLGRADCTGPTRQEEPDQTRYHKISEVEFASIYLLVWVMQWGSMISFFKVRNLNCSFSIHMLLLPIPGAREKKHWRCQGVNRARIAPDTRYRRFR